MTIVYDCSMLKIASSTIYIIYWHTEYITTTSLTLNLLNFLTLNPLNFLTLNLLNFLILNLMNFLTLNLMNFLTLNLMNFLNGIIHLPFLELSVIIIWDIKNRTWKMVSQQYRAWSNCTDVQAGLALYWWQRLITFGSSKRRVKWTCQASRFGTILFLDINFGDIKRRIWCWIANW